MSNRELLAVVIRNGTASCSSLEIADQIIIKCGGMNFLPSLTIFQLCEIKGIQKIKAIEILSCIELSKRVLKENIFEKNIVTSPKALIDWLNMEIGNINQELFLVIYLNVKNHIISYKILFKGTVNASLVDPKEIFKEAFMLSACKIMIAHNHPSNDLTPSNADINITKQIMKIAQLVDIEFLDHLIISCNNYFSFKQEGLIN